MQDTGSVAAASIGPWLDKYARMMRLAHDAILALNSTPAMLYASIDQVGTAWWAARWVMSTCARGQAPAAMQDGVHHQPTQATRSLHAAVPPERAAL